MATTTSPENMLTKHPVLVGLKALTDRAASVRYSAIGKLCTASIRDDCQGRPSEIPGHQNSTEQKIRTLVVNAAGRFH